MLKVTPYNVIMTMGMCVWIAVVVAFALVISVAMYISYVVIKCVTGLVALISGVLPWMQNTLRR